jgi:hypothetical protein
MQNQNPLVAGMHADLAAAHGGYSQLYFAYQWRQLVDLHFLDNKVDMEGYSRIREIIQAANDGDSAMSFASPHVSKAYCGVLFASALCSEGHFAHSCGPWNFGHEHPMVGEHLGRGLSYLKANGFIELKGTKWHIRRDIEWPHFPRQMLLGFDALDYVYPL